jgi:hypothetical protein
LVKVRLQIALGGSEASLERRTDELLRLLRLD